MRLPPNMLKVLMALHNTENNKGVATYQTAFALSERGLVSVLNGGFPAKTQGLAFPELTVELTEEGRNFCNQKFQTTKTD